MLTRARKIGLNCMILTSLVIMASFPCKAQTVIGTKGMMNVPTADMNPAGTFDGGGSFMQKEITEERAYNTWLYYVSFTAFSWLEMTYRGTLLKERKSATDPSVGFYNQNRSFSLRIRPLKEGKYWPAIVIGANDFLKQNTADGLTGGALNSYARVYGVATKHFPIASVGTIGTTVGYARPIRGGAANEGVMGGLSFSPAFFPEMRVMGEYDSDGFNVGASAFLFKHLNLTCFTREFKGINATLSYQYTIKF